MAVLSHTLNNHQSKKVAVIVNNMSKINIDAFLLSSETSYSKFRSS